jgi:hypothetical protein
LVLQEVARRAQQKEAVKVTVEGLRSELFDKQLAVLDDPAKEIAVLCSRRAGKTSMWPRVAVICALEKPRGLIRIWAASLLRAEQMIWTELKLVCARHKIEAEFNNTKFVCRFANGSEIRLLGADKQKEAEKKRGDKTSMEIVLESQLFGSYLKTIVEDIAGPCLADLNGTFYLEGTPGPVCTGYWYSASGENGTSSRWVSGGRDVQGSLEGAGWSCHRWSLLDNPFPSGKKHWHDWLAARKLKRNWADDNPTYQREYLGRWINDTSTLYYSGFDPVRNTYDAKTFQAWGPGWTHVLGWDLVLGLPPRVPQAVRGVQLEEVRGPVSRRGHGADLAAREEGLQFHDHGRGHRRWRQDVRRAGPEGPATRVHTRQEDRQV